MKKESGDLKDFIDCLNVDYQHHISKILLNSHNDDQDENTE